MATNSDTTMPLPLDFRGDVAMRKARTTKLVMPLPAELPVEDPVAAAEDAEAEMEWSYDDPELTQQLRASHVGRGRILAAIGASVLAVALGVAFVF